MEYLPEIESVPTPDAAKTRRAASFCAFAAVAAILFSYTVLTVLALLTRDVAVDEHTYSNLTLLANTVVIDLVAMPLAWILLLRRVPRNETPEIETRTPLNLSTLLFLFPCAFVLMYAGALLGRLVGALLGGDLSDVVGSTIETVDPWVTLVSAVIVGPIAEELFFRKAMIDRLSAFHPTDAILFSSLLFGLIHGNVTQFLYAFPLGILFGIIYYRTQNIGYTILLHIAVNTLGGLIPQLVTMWTGKLPEFGETVVMAIYMQLILALCIVGLISLIRRRRNFLPIPTKLPRFRRPFYLNAGFIVACVVFTALFLLNEILA